MAALQATDGEVNMVVWVTAICGAICANVQPAREPSDLIEGGVDGSQHQATQPEILLDEPVLVGVTPEDVDLVPFKDRFCAVDFDDFFVVEEALRGSHGG
jgi:hypothetical protein